MGDPLAHRLTIPLRWRDIDLLGHLNQSVYHELLEEARIGLIAELLARAGQTEHVHGAYVLRHVELDHHREVRRDHGAVEVSAQVAKLGRTSVTLDHELRRPDGILAASGRSVLVGWDPAIRGKRALGAAERAALGGG